MGNVGGQQLCVVSKSEDSATKSGGQGNMREGKNGLFSVKSMFKMLDAAPPQFSAKIIGQPKMQPRICFLLGRQLGKGF